MAEGQIRFEFRLFRKKINYLLNKLKCDVEFDLINMAEAIGVDELLDRLGGLYGTGKFLKKKEAFHRIALSKHRQPVRTAMRRIIEDTRRGNLMIALENFDGDRSRIMRCFNDLGMSPITIPESWIVEEFENPITYIETRNVNERDLV